MSEFHIESYSSSMVVTGVNTAEKAGLAGDAIYSVVQFQVFFSLVNLTYYPLGDTAL